MLFFLQENLKGGILYFPFVLSVAAIDPVCNGCLEYKSFFCFLTFPAQRFVIGQGVQVDVVSVVITGCVLSSPILRLFFLFLFSNLFLGRKWRRKHEQHTQQTKLHLLRLNPLRVNNVVWMYKIRNDLSLYGTKVIDY